MRRPSMRVGAFFDLKRLERVHDVTVAAVKG